MGRAANFILRWIIAAIAVGFAVFIVPGISMPMGENGQILGILGISVFLALINITIKPALQTLSLPLSCLTLGIFSLVVNTALLYLAAWCAGAFFGLDITIANFGSAFVASIIISIVTSVLSSITALE